MPLFNPTQNVLNTKIATKSTFPACFCIEHPNEYRCDWNTDRMYRADLLPLALPCNEKNGKHWGFSSCAIFISSIVCCIRKQRFSFRLVMVDGWCDRNSIRSVIGTSFLCTFRERVRRRILVRLDSHFMDFLEMVCKLSKSHRSKKTNKLKTALLKHK